MQEEEEKRKRRRAMLKMDQETQPENKKTEGQEGKRNGIRKVREGREQSQLKKKIRKKENEARS